MESEEMLASAPGEQPLNDYAITIKDCNSIAEAHISLRRGSLNIKYGPNGIGKSTIARALVLGSQGEGALDERFPLKYREGDGHPSPSVAARESTSSVSATPACRRRS